MRNDAATVLLVISILFFLGSCLLLGDMRESEEGFMRRYRAHVPLLQWAVHIQSERVRDPAQSIKSLAALSPSFSIPKEAECLVLTPGQRTGFYAGIDFVITNPPPQSMMVLSNGVVLEGSPPPSAKQQ